MAERNEKKKNGAEIGNGLLPIEHQAGRWAGCGSRMGAGLGVLGAGLGRWAHAGKHGRRAWALGVARRQECVGARQAQAGGSSVRAQLARGRARQAGRRRAGRARQAGRRRAGRERQARHGRAGGARQALARGVGERAAGRSRSAR